MKYDDEYRDKKLSQSIINRIKGLTEEEINLMEVCGTHTVSIFRSGIKSLLPKNIHLISGPGCPVCVTPVSEIDHIIALARMENTTIVTFGDMINVPGSSSSLKKERARGADVRIIYSPRQALEIAQQFPEKKVILIGIGFETTTPLLASVMLEAKEKAITNFFLLSLGKLMPPIIRSLLGSHEVRIDGMLCPGHVSAIIGVKPYQFIPDCYKIGCVIAGFEPVDILLAIYHLLLQKIKENPRVENKYSRAVREEGNPVALNLLQQVFIPVESEWRGIGKIEGSGLALRPEYSAWDANNFTLKLEISRENKQCLCGEVLRGIAIPPDCPLFQTVCTPENPAGACMVSSEGTCAAYYKYNTV